MMDEELDAVIAQAAAEKKANEERQRALKLACTFDCTHSREDLQAPQFSSLQPEFEFINQPFI